MYNKKPIIGAVFIRAESSFHSTFDTPRTKKDNIKASYIYFPDVKATRDFVERQFRAVGKTA